MPPTTTRPANRTAVASRAGSQGNRSGSLAHAGNIDTLVALHEAAPVERVDVPDDGVDRRDAQAVAQLRKRGRVAPSRCQIAQ